MPRETVPGTGGYDVRVGWTSGSDVQLGLESTTERVSLLRSLYGDEASLEAIGRAAKAMGLSTNTPQTAEHPGSGVPPSQIAGIRQEQDRLGMVSFGAELLAAVEGVRDVGSDADGITYDRQYDGVWATIGRDGINSLIRYLRRARDSAYGRDE